MVSGYGLRAITAMVVALFWRNDESPVYPHGNNFSTFNRRRIDTDP
jgi:hypothetical protein